MLLVLGPVLGVSVVDLYAAAMLPGLPAGGAVSRLRPRPLPARAAASGRRCRRRCVPPRRFSIAREALIGVIPLAVLIAATLGPILAGLATPTEAAGVGALGALALALAYGRLDCAGLKAVSLRTLATSSMVLFLAVASNVFGAVFARLGTRGLDHRVAARPQRCRRC